MINTLCGSMGSVKSNEITSISCKQQPTSPTASVSESNNVVTTSEFEQGDQLNHPPPMSYQGRIKFEGDAQDVEVQSPDNSIWESIYSDQIDVSDFMILSPRRDYTVSSPKTDCMMVSSPKRGDYYYMVSSPKRPDYMISSPKREQLIISSSPKRAIPGMAHSGYSHHNYSYVQQSMNGQSLHGCSIPSSYNSVQMGGYSKGKSQSPLHKVFNSSNNEFVHHQPESLLLPAIDGFLDDYHRDRDTFIGGPQQQLMKAVGCGGESFDMALPAGILDCSSMPSSRFCGPTNESTALGLQMSQEIRDDVYQLSSFVDAADEEAFIGAPQAPLRIMQPQKQQPQQSLEQLLMAPIPTSGTEQEQDSGLELVHLLLACAEAVAKDDYLSARRCLHHLNGAVSPVGDSMQRVAACFTGALADRLTAATAANTSNPPKPFPSYPPNSLEILKIYQILYQACPYIKFAHFTANQAIFEAFEAEERVHVIDLDILQGYQWPAFMQALAARPGGPPFLRITGVGTPLEFVKETGRRLSDLAHSFHVPFEFHPVGERLVNLKPHMFNRRVGEALAVNSFNQLHRVPPGVTLSNLISMIRDQAPNIVTLIEQEASHNGPYFLGRFLEALHYYSAIFDSLDATFSSDSPERAKVEHYVLAPEIRNVVACEGPERIERHEKLDKWRKIMEGKGFKSVPLSSNAVTQSKILLDLYPCDGYRLTEDKGCLLLGWQDRAILAASAWRC